MLDVNMFKNGLKKLRISVVEFECEGSTSALKDVDVTVFYNKAMKSDPQFSRY